MSKHAFVFFYNFSVFVGICAIGLAILLWYRQRDSRHARQIAFLASLCFYGFLNLLMYYEVSILSIYSFSAVFSIAVSFAFLLLYYCWFLYLRANMGPLPGRFSERILNVLFLLCAVLWACDSLFFMDPEFNIRHQTGSLLATLCDVFLLFYFFAIHLMYRALFKRMESRQTKWYIGILSFVLLVFFTYVTIKDLRISIFLYNVAAWFGNNVSICALLCFTINFASILFCGSQLRDHFRAELQIPAPSAKELALQELAVSLSLSAREEAVLELIFQGLSNDEIASSLFISVNTVKKHVNSILRKAKVKNRVDLFTRYR